MQTEIRLFPKNRLELQIREDIEDTLKCLNIGTPKIINFPFVPNGKLMVFRSPSIFKHIYELM